MINEPAQPAPPSRRRWLGVATAAAAVVLIGAGYATANAATVSDDKGAPARTLARGVTGVPAVVDAANAFVATLTDDQKTAVLLDFSAENATAWSNLPCGGSCRPGIEFGTLSEPQLAAAKRVVQAAMGTDRGTGFDQVTKILQADDLLAANNTGAPTGAPTATGSASPTMSSDPTATSEPTATTTADPTTTATGDPSATTTADPTATATATATGDPTATATATPTDVPSGPPGGGGGPGGFNYGSGFYYLAFLGTPSVTGTWQLHFGGHHLAVDLTYKDGKVAGASPFFIGVEPTTFTDDAGATVQPLEIMRRGMAKLTGSLTADQQAKAQLTASFGDVLVGPGKDGQFPTTKAGIAVRDLSPAQKRLVLNAIRPWVAGADDATAAQLMRTYESQLDQTFVAFSGGLGLDTQGDYVRIDGPGVWIEFICQNGVVFQNQIHFHTVYRDHVRDYGGEFTF